MEPKEKEIKMRKDILDELYKPFNLKSRVGVGNKTFKYVPTNDIVDRMNKAFAGSWSTELISSEVIDDQILVLVRVHVTDGESASVYYFHDGYASQPLARYTSGTNAGKVIDLGNCYKSAMSKAIKTAVAKWGVGLYLEGEEVASESVQSDMPFLPNVGSTPSTPLVQTPTATPPVNTPPVNTPPVAGPVAEPVVNTPPAGSPMGGSSGHAPPAFTSVNPAPVTDIVPPPMDLPQANIKENLTDVQKVAIETIMSVHNLTFPELGAKALERSDNLPPSLDVVSYSDAVKMIQFGNNLRPGQSS